MKDKIKKAIHTFKYGRRDIEPNRSSALFKVIAGAYLVYLGYHLLENTDNEYSRTVIVLTAALFFVIAFIIGLKGYFEYKIAIYGREDSEEPCEPEEESPELPTDSEDILKDDPESRE